MFYKCDLLIEFPLFDNKKNIFNQYTIKNDNTIEYEDSMNSNELYFNCKTTEIRKEKERTNVSDSTIFDGYSKVSFIPNNSNWNTCNCINMDSMFDGCTSLLSLPDVSKWNTINVKNMSNLFNECSALISIPDISKWNTKNVYDIGNMFSKCSALISLPDISKWNTENINNMSYLFYGCSSLLQFLIYLNGIFLKLLILKAYLKIV